MCTCTSRREGRLSQEADSASCKSREIEYKEAVNAKRCSAISVEQDAGYHGVVLLENVLRQRGAGMLPSTKLAKLSQETRLSGLAHSSTA